MRGVIIGSDVLNVRDEFLEMCNRFGSWGLGYVEVKIEDGLENVER